MEYTNPRITFYIICQLTIQAQSIETYSDRHTAGWMKWIKTILK